MAKASLTPEQLAEKARAVRMRVLEMFKTGGGHYGACFSAADIFTVLYFRILNLDPKNPKWEDRDRFVLSKGHAGAALYATLSERGFFPAEELRTYNQLGSAFGLHPDMKKIPGIEMSTGSLGHGFPVAVGMALAARLDKKNSRVFTLVGDGESHEGTIWEAAMSAAHFKLDNLTTIVDYNRLSMDGFVDQVMSLEPLTEKWKSFGWAVRAVNGHSIPEVIAALEAVPFEKGKPSLIVANTVKGKGVSFIENSPAWHLGKMTAEQHEKAWAEVSGCKI